MAVKEPMHLVEELERQFQTLHDKIVESKEHYIATHQKDYDKASRTVKAAQKKLRVAKNRVAKAAAGMAKSSSETAHNQLKKAQAAASLLGESVHEAKSILTSAESNLKTARPFARKLAARSKALKAFEREWAMKEKAGAAAKAKKAAASRKKKKSPA